MLALSPESQQSNDEAEGSIHLSLSPPLEHPDLLEGLFAAEQTQVIGSVQESDSNQSKVAKDGVDLDSAAAELAVAWHLVAAVVEAAVPPSFPAPGL